MNRRASSPRPSPPKEEREDHLARFGFMVPMHDFAIEEALHEQKTEMGLLSPTLSSGGGEGEPPEDSRFMVPMHAPKRKEAFLEPEVLDCASLLALFELPFCNSA